MKNRIALKWARNPLLAILLLAAFSSRVLIPPGFMPGAGGLVVCSGFMPAPSSMPHDMPGMDMSAMGMDHHGHHPTQGGGSSPHETSTLCSFAATAGALAHHHLSSLPAVVPAAPPRLVVVQSTFVPRSTIVPTRLPRGPPSLI